MVLRCFVFLCLVSVSFSYMIKEGTVCSIKVGNTSVAGECKTIGKCPYAIKLLYEDEKKPPMCGWNFDVRIVCCPIANQHFRTGIHGRLYEPTSDGVKRSGAVTCRYDGTQHQCCPNKPDIPLPDEPKGCPPLDIPSQFESLSPIQRIAWDKCLEAQRFVHPCVVSEDDRLWLVRKNTCEIMNRFRISSGVPAQAMEFPHMNGATMPYASKASFFQNLEFHLHRDVCSYFVSQSWSTFPTCVLNNAGDMAVLGVVENPDHPEADVKWVGGGSLISDRFILTAAHVLIDPEKRPLRYALLGTLNKTDVLNGLLYNIVHKIVYPHYDHNKLHDIALLELDRRVTLSKFVRPICLPVPGQGVWNKARDIAGWGQTSEGDKNTSQILYTAPVQLLESNAPECKRTFKHYNSYTMMCALGQNGDQNSQRPDSCPGDSGGPLMAMLQNIDCSYSVEGVVSFGPHCGKNSAGVYTRVAYYLPWIVQHVWPQEFTRATGAGRNLL